MGTGFLLRDFTFLMAPEPTFKVSPEFFHRAKVRMIIGFFLELTWSLPVIAITITVSRMLPSRAPLWFAASVALGLLLGITYAFALSQVVGPMVFAVRIPVLPFMATIGLLAGLLSSMKHWQDVVASWQIYSLCALVAIVWTVYIVLARKVTSTDAVCVVVVKRSPSSGSSRWDADDRSVTLNQAERMRVQESVGGGDDSILKPMFSFEEGQRSQAKVILVMTKDVGRPISFPIPDSDVEILRQNQDETWQTDLHGTHMGNNKISLSQANNSDFTRIELLGPFGTQSSEVGVSHE